MQFAQGVPNMETARPSVFGQYIPLGQDIPPAMVNNDASAAWLQVPPSPMPWGIPMANQPAIVRFTAEPAAAIKSPVIEESGVCMAGSFAQSKRKLDAEEELLPPMKQHITEEKMAAHLSQLHISPDYTAHQAGILQPQQQVAPSSQETEQQQQLKRLVMCEEIRKLKQEPIIPTSLLAKLEKPNMALVLWQPPTGNIGSALRVAASRSGGNAETEETVEQQQRQTMQFNNNNTSILDLNTISMLGYQPSSSDSMMDL